MYVSIVAYLALILFLPFAVVAYAVQRPAMATATVLLTAILFLPEHVGFDAPGLPPFDKATIAGLCALAGCVATTRGKLQRARAGRGVDVFAIILLVSVFATSLTNKDTLTYGPRVIRALTPYDGFSEVVRTFLYAIIPYFLGRVLYRDTQDAWDLMRSVVMAALLYTPFILLELRMSPQLHRWVYGFHQHEFAQTMREGGYRPMVFMPHGLALAMFLLTASLFAFAMGRLRLRLPFGLPGRAVGTFFFLLLIACKSMGAAVYGLVCIPLILFTSPKPQRRVASWMAFLVMAYPALRITGEFPVQGLLDAAARWSQERADSLAFRFYNEAELVNKALQRLWCGWGGFGRARIWAEWGQDISVTDGHWIIIFGTYGVIGMVGQYGLLLMPIFLAARRLRRIADPGERLLVAAFALVTAVNVIDLLPNGMYTGLPLFFSGALDGISSGLLRNGRARSALV